MCAPSMPQPPDPYATASAESQFNRPDLYSPAGGGIFHGYTDQNGSFAQGVAPPGMQSAVQYIESPNEEAIRTLLQPAAINFANNIISQDLPGRATPQDTQHIADAMYDRAAGMLMPTIDQSNRRLLDRLQAGGHPVGSAGFNEAYGNQQRETQDMLSRLAMDAQLQAGNEQTRLYGLESGPRNQAMAEIAALMSGQYSPPNPIPQNNDPSVNYGGMVSENYQAQMQQYQAQMQQQMGLFGTLGNLGASLMFMSSAKSKDLRGTVDPAVASRVVAGLEIYDWSYKEGYGDPRDRHIGPTAEDFHDATGLSSPNGISLIDYTGLLAAALKDALKRIEDLEGRLGS